ncbi:MAG: SGNH/GDSL hydrolase family protein [Treponemataceae bacterium]
MKTILCYGDSNTWGADPATGGRFDRFTRWAGVMRGILNADCPPSDPEYWVVEEGQNGRTTCRDDPVEPGRNGLAYIQTILESHKPLDLVIVFLGTNDLKVRFAPTAQDIARGAQRVVAAAQNSGTGIDGKAPKTLMIVPAPVARLSYFKETFAGSEEISKKLAARYRQYAAEIGSEFLDAGSVIVSSDLDGIHLDRDQHKKLGEAIAEKVKTMLG